MYTTIFKWLLPVLVVLGLAYAVNNGIQTWLSNQETARLDMVKLATSARDAEIKAAAAQLSLETTKNLLEAEKLNNGRLQTSLTASQQNANRLKSAARARDFSVTVQGQPLEAASTATLEINSLFETMQRRNQHFGQQTTGAPQ